MRDFDRYDDERLLGDERPDAFAAFYRRHEDSVLRFFVRRTARGDLAADLAAETFARVLESRPRFDPAIGAARSWLFGIARNVLLRSMELGRVDETARRRLQMERLVLTADEILSIEALQDSPALDTLESLPIEQAEAVRRRVLLDDSYGSIARDLQCSEAVVRQRVSRGLRQLRTHLGGTHR